MAGFKLDMAKAFDRVHWGYLKQVMSQMGFSDRWVGWIMECVTTVSFLVMVNGESCGHFQPNRGI